MPADRPGGRKRPRAVGLRRGGRGRIDLPGWAFRLFTRAGVGEHPWDEDPGRILREDVPIAEAWLDTFPTAPRLEGRRVVEFGCGFGALCVVAARRGASGVLGVEVDRERADLARSLVDRQFPGPAGRIEFAAYDEAGKAEGEDRFDVVLSQNAFEHYEEPEAVLARMTALLRPGGTLYAGFGPLWESPWGSHLSSVCRLPWAHLWAGRRLIEAHNRARPHDPRDGWEAFGLNRVALPRFRRMFEAAEGCELLRFDRNATIRRRSRALYRLLEGVGRVPGARRYLTASLFVVLRRRGVRPPKETSGAGEVRRERAVTEGIHHEGQRIGR